MAVVVVENNVGLHSRAQVVIVAPFVGGGSGRPPFRSGGFFDGAEGRTGFYLSVGSRRGP